MPAQIQVPTFIGRLLMLHHVYHYLLSQRILSLCGHWMVISIFQEIFKQPLHSAAEGKPVKHN